ncbi:MAG: hypothetical protein KDA28_15625, partial [Phycisphaerales bacterium]|nr:hypothetical protein [Phycisphaerales bacterium]
MTVEGLVVIGVVASIVGLLALTRIAPDAVLAAGLTALLAIPIPTDTGWTFGVMSPTAAMSGFGNTGMLTVGVLFIIVAGLRETGGIDWVATRLLSRPGGERRALIRMMLPTLGLSAFLNNTPVVAMMIPAVQDW